MDNLSVCDKTDQMQICLCWIVQSSFLLSIHSVTAFACHITIFPSWDICVSPQNKKVQMAITAVQLNSFQATFDTCTKSNFQRHCGNLHLDSFDTSHPQLLFPSNSIVLWFKFMHDFI